MIWGMKISNKNRIITVLATALLPCLAASTTADSQRLMQPCLADTTSSHAAPAAGAPSVSIEKETGTGSELYNFKEKALDGSEIDFKNYKGDVLLIVNTASKCGFTPQYAGLEELSKKYSPKGLKVLGFPCNQFGAQEPGDSEAIHSFCQKNYGVDFQMFDKIDVNGKGASELYTYLKKEAPDEKGDIAWNFTKFLVDRKGHVVKRFDSKTKPDAISADIEKLL